MSGWHARLSASGASRWLNCPGSLRESEGIVEPPSEYAAEGTFAHDVARQLLYKSTPKILMGQRGVIDGFDFTVDQELLDYLEVYTDYIRGFGASELLIEQEFTDALRELDPDFGGTADAVLWDATTKTLRVVDLKYGAGVMVGAEDNSQLKYYALGALLSNPQWAAERVIVAIVQPRIQSREPIDEWEFDAVDLLDFAADLKDAAEMTRHPEAPLHSGDWCKFCKARPHCPELRRQQDIVVSDMFDPVVGLASDPEKLAEALAILPAVEHRIHAIRELAYDEAVKGNAPPGWKLVDKRATRKWADAEAAEGWAKKALGEKAFTEPALKSPAQVEKLLGKKAKLPESLVEKKSSGYNLVPTSDKRPPALLAQPDDFDEVTE